MAITTDTDLANAALGLIGEAQVTNITDTSSKGARVCLLHADNARREVLRMARWNCATKRATLSRLASAPTGSTASGFAYRYQLPTDFLRLAEVNGESTRNSDEYFEIEGSELITDADSVWIRYIADLGIGALDPLLQSAVIARLASLAAIPMSARIEQAQYLEKLFRQRVAEARTADAREAGSGENPRWNRTLGRSRMNQARGIRRDPTRIEDF